MTPALRFQTFDLLATLVAVVGSDGAVLFANAALEDALGISRRAIVGSHFPDSFTEPGHLQTALQGAGGNEFAALRYDAWLRRLNYDPMPVHVIVTLTETAGEIIVELLPLEQQARQDREERLAEQAQANKELIRNLAHEIKNPLGGIRGAAQLLEQSVSSEEAVLCDWLVDAGMTHERRILRLPIGGLTWHYPEPDILQLEFVLPAGCFATVVVRELVDLLPAGQTDTSCVF